MIVNFDRELAIALNLKFFEHALSGFAARHFFLEAVRCSEPEPKLCLAGVACLLHGIEGVLGQIVFEEQTENKLAEDDPQSRHKHRNLNHQLLVAASQFGFDIETLAFPEELGKMLDLAKSQQEIGILMFRNEFSHGKAYRLTQRLGDDLISDSIMLSPHFKELLDLSYSFAEEVARFTGREVPQACTNPFNT